MNILFLASAWRVSLIKAFQEVKKTKKFDIRLIAADSDALSPSLYCADQFHVLPMFSSPEFHSRFLDLCRSEAITAIIPLSDKAIAALLKLKPDLESMNVFPVISSAATIHICLDKWETFRFCKKNSIPTPETLLYQKNICDIPFEFPLFLKKREGEGSNDTCIIKTEEQLKALQLDEEYIVQNYIEGTEYTIDVLSDFSGGPLSVVPRERLAVRGGEVLKGKTVLNNELVQWGTEIAAKLKICGPATIQCIKGKEGNYFFTDINNRFGSGAVLSFAAGANYPGMLIKLIKGEKVKKIIGEYEENLFMMRYDEAIFSKGRELEARGQGAGGRGQEVKSRRQKAEDPKSQTRNLCRAVVLQPGFLPWLGFFELMFKCDVFIFLDDVQYTKRDWRSRNKIKTSNGPEWLTLPVITKGRFTQLIKETELDNNQNWAKQHLNTMKMNYSRALYFDALFPEIEGIYNRSWTLIYDIDIALIKLLMKELGLKRRLLRSSELNGSIKESAKNKVIKICKAVGATHFYNGAAGRDIYDFETFEKNNIVLEFQNYRHPEYQQLWGDFVPYLSTIDLLFNHGPESLDILLNRTEQPQSK